MRFFPYPKRSRHLKPPRSHNSLIHGPLPRKYWDHSTKVIRWMGRNALRKLRLYYDARATFPDREALSSWILDITYDTNAINEFDFDKLDNMAEKAAEYALDVWDEEVVLRIRSRARNGGLKSKRSKSITMDMVAPYRDLTSVEAAKALGCSPRTVQRRRAELKAVEREALTAALDALFDEPLISETVSNDVRGSFTAREGEAAAHLDNVRIGIVRNDETAYSEIDRLLDGLLDEIPSQVLP